MESNRDILTIDRNPYPPLSDQRERGYTRLSSGRAAMIKVSILEGGESGLDCQMERGYNQALC